jgi:hypothetical protein
LAAGERKSVIVTPLVRLFSFGVPVYPLTTVVHIWEYQRYHGYHASLHNISQHPDFPAFDKKLKELIISKDSSLMQEFSFWPTTPPRKLGGLFELRSYTLHPGNLLEWETHWRKGLKARREVMEGVGAWFVQIGELNTVHHLWQFANLEERKARRELSWGVEGWAETVHKVCSSGPFSSHITDALQKDCSLDSGHEITNNCANAVVPRWIATVLAPER